MAVFDKKSEKGNNIERSSIIPDELLLLGISAFLIFFLEDYLRLLVPNDPGIVANSVGYVLVFFVLTVSYFPKKIPRSHYIIVGVTALFLRLRVLFFKPVVSSDLHRNLLFGSVLAGGWNPYLWTIETIPALLEQGFVTKVSYIQEWVSHSYDYPALAILFFAAVTFFVPADNYSAFVLAKSVLMLVDVANAYLIYRTLKDHFGKEEVGKKMGLLYLLNPLAIFWVGLEGQFEPIPLFFTFLSIYLVLSTHETSIVPEKYQFLIPYVAGLMLACGALFKYFPVFFVPAIIFFFGRQVKPIIRFLSTFIFSSFLLSIPFVFSSYYVTNFVKFQINRTHHNLDEATFPLYIIDVPFFLLIGAILALSLFLIAKNRDRKQLMMWVGTATLFLFIVVNNSIFSWYVLWIFPTLFFTAVPQDEYSRSLYWGLGLSIYIVMWSPAELEVMFQVIAVTAVLTLTSFRTQVKQQIFGLLGLGSYVAPIPSQSSQSNLPKNGEL